MPDRYWEQPITKMPSSSTEQRSNLTRVIQEIAHHRRDARDRARQALAQHSLIEAAADAIPWGVVAEREAKSSAQVAYVTMRATTQVANTLRRAGLTVESAADLTTPEAQAVLAQTHDPIAPEDPGVLRKLTGTLSEKIRTTFEADPALRTQAATLMLIEAWADLDQTGDDADTTAALVDQISGAGGWTWLASHHFNWSDLAANSDTDERGEHALIPVFDDQGYGLILTDLISRGTRKALVSTWAGHQNVAPTFPYETKVGNIVYTYKADDALLKTAWKRVEALGDEHADLFDYIMMKMLALKAAHARDVYGSFTITPEEFLEARGITKHRHGGYEMAQKLDVVELIGDLANITLTGAYTIEEQSGRHKQKRHVTHEDDVQLIQISRTSYRITLTGERVPYQWTVRLGDWAKPIENTSPQYARLMAGLLKLHASKERYAKRLGRYLIGQFRIRMHRGKPDQAIKVRTLLDGAGIDIPDRNKPAFRTRVERALDQLKDPTLLQGPTCIDSWHYQRKVDMQARDWFTRWLDMGVVFTVPSEVTAPLPTITDALPAMIISSTGEDYSPSRKIVTS